MIIERKYLCPRWISNLFTMELYKRVQNNVVNILLEIITIENLFIY